MSHNRIISENQLDQWVRGNARDAQGVIVELVWRLVSASAPRPKGRRFPLGDSIGQPGPDGFLETDFAFDPFVPEGTSFWEIGTSARAKTKATKDYGERTRETPVEIRRESTFVFVTPLSGGRDWQFTWKPEAQAKWLADRRKRKEWRDVRTIDGSKLIDWMYSFPGVERWLAGKMGFPFSGVKTLEDRWNTLRTIGAPPPLTYDLFLANREKACEKLKEVFSGTTLQLKLETHFPGQVVDFVSAFVASMGEETRIDALARSLVISDADSWNATTSLDKAHTLVADFDLDDSDGSATRLLEKARRAGHPVIYGGVPGGIPHPNIVSIPNPKSYQIKETLQKAGYKEERARALAQRSDGNLTSLLRCLQNLSLMPEWAQGTDAAELAIAELLGAWDERCEADKTVAEALSRKGYGEWIGKIREISLRPGTPLIQRDRTWKVVARYEGWYALGPTLFDDHLDRLKTAAVSILCEKDPKFDLPPDERYMASIRDKVLRHSRLLRSGLAETLALLGSHSKALTSCSSGRPEATASLAVREILAGADWVLWASLNDLLPLLAEAAPKEFLDAVENSLMADPCPFDTIFKQEGPAMFGDNYITGLLWAMETLAWDPQYLTRVVVVLGQLARRDPGGNWANRPANSLSTILLPWLPQTCASVSGRKTAVATLMQELPDVGWRLLLGLLPSGHTMSSGSRRPAWRAMIEDNRPDGVTVGEYREQIGIYVELAANMAKSDPSKLGDLIDRLDDLPPPTREEVLVHLTSNATISMSSTDRFALWAKLTDLVSKHRKFADAKWAMKPEEVDAIAAVTEQLMPESPGLRHRRLFTQRGFDLYEERGNFEEQRKKLEERRQKAIDEIFRGGGIQAVLDFARDVESPWLAGTAFGMVAENLADSHILPGLLLTEDKPLASFAGGFVCGRFCALGWRWVDEIETSQWTSTQKGQLLAYLPFVPEAWERSARLLGEDESAYWTKAAASAYGTERGLEFAVDRLTQYGRPHAAIKCLQGRIYAKVKLDSQQAVRTLIAALSSSEDTHSIDVHGIIDVIKALQNDPQANADDVCKIEWAYLSLLNRHSGAFPKSLERHLADDPQFFCEIIRIVFRSKNEDRPAREPSQQEKDTARNAYHLLSEWQTPPGTREDGFDGNALATWLGAVKASCAQSGHLEKALLMVGQVLVYTPPDPDGLWIHHSAAAALNAQDAGDMRAGFRTELFNSRGMHGFTAGREERELAAKYRIQADEVEYRGYHRLAASLRALADEYEHDAEQEETRDPYDN